MALFAGLQFVVDFNSSTPYKTKKWRKDQIINNGGIISYIVTKKATHFILEGPDKLDSYKCKQARKLDLPICSFELIDQCINAGKLVSPSPYLLEKSTQDQSFDKGLIKGSRGDSNTKRIKRLFNPASAKLLTQEEFTDQTPFSKSYQVAKGTVLKQLSPNGEILQLAVVEIGAVKTVPQNKYRVSQSVYQLHVFTSKNDVVSEHCIHERSEDSLSVYSYLIESLIKKGYTQVNTRDVIPVSTLGSEQFNQWWLSFTSEQNISPEVAMLVESIMQEATEMYKQLAIPFNMLNLDDVEKAEGVLLQLKTLLQKGKDSSQEESGKLSKQFYQILPTTNKPVIRTVKDVAKKLDFCQFLKDMINVGEATNWSDDASILSKYRSLRCNIKHVNESSDVYQTVYDIIGAQDSVNVDIHNVYTINRPIEEQLFADDIGNNRLLMHASAPQNFVGLLSRGLLLPNTVESEYGGVRSDVGMLGCGIYFGNNLSTSIKYSSPSKARGTRLMLVSEVALGKCWDMYSKNTDLTSPPEGHDSVHGVGQRGISDFDFDEFVIYNTTQQKIKYLVEFSSKDTDRVKEISVNMDAEPEDLELDEEMSTLDIKDVKERQNLLEKVKAGLQSSGDTPVPLKSVHVRAKLLDLAAQVVVLQEYHNDNNSAIEAKYVFPLDENAAVCGFEAFINGKHIIGEVKEKEQAHKEYKEAISKGHGAYLMDEEKPDVFTVSVGNLPPKSSVLIKITYVVELFVDGELINFTLPAAVAPWEKDPALSKVTQEDVDTVKIAQQTSNNTSVQVAIDMPFEIRTINSPTHSKLNVKQTACKAVIQLPKNATLGQDGFKLQIGLAEVHVPRMWVEEDEESDQRAVMLTFYPQFEVTTPGETEIQFLIDCSNSMDIETFNSAKRALVLALQEMPETYKFNIIAFGTYFKELFTHAKQKTTKLIKEAENFVQTLRPNLGTTDAWRPLSIFNLLPPTDNWRNVFLISDGHLSNIQATMTSASCHGSKNRIFTLGVGSHVKHHTLRSLARVGCGSYEYYDESTKSKWIPKIESQLQKSAQPGLNSVSVNWQTFSDDAPIQQAPTQIMSLFSGSRQVVYGFVDNCLQATLEANVDGQEISTMVSTHDLGVTQGKILHTLTAKAMIRDWNDGLLATDVIEHEIKKKNDKSKIISLSIKYSIVTKFTSFVAIEKREKGEKKIDGPSIDELVDKERVDHLQELGWTYGDPDDEDLNKKVERLQKDAKMTATFSVLSAQKCYTELLDSALKLEGPKFADLKKEVGNDIYEFYKDGLGDEMTGKELAGKCGVLFEFPLSIRTLTGKTENYSCSQDMTVEDLIKKLEPSHGSSLRLIFGGKQLVPERKLNDYGIEENSIVHLVLRLKGGPTEPRRTDLTKTFSRPLCRALPSCALTKYDTAQDQALGMIKQKCTEMNARGTFPEKYRTRKSAVFEKAERVSAMRAQRGLQPDVYEYAEMSSKPSKKVHGGLQPEADDLYEQQSFKVTETSDFFADSSSYFDMALSKKKKKKQKIGDLVRVGNLDEDGQLEECMEDSGMDWSREDVEISDAVRPHRRGSGTTLKGAVRHSRKLTTDFSELSLGTPSTPPSPPMSVETKGTAFFAPPPPPLQAARGHVPPPPPPQAARGHVPPPPPPMAAPKSSIEFTFGGPPLPHGAAGGPPRAKFAQTPPPPTPPGSVQSKSLGGFKAQVSAYGTKKAQTSPPSTMKTLISKPIPKPAALEPEQSKQLIHQMRFRSITKSIPTKLEEKILPESKMAPTEKSAPGYRVGMTLKSKALPEIESDALMDVASDALMMDYCEEPAKMMREEESMAKGWDADDDDDCDDEMGFGLFGDSGINNGKSYERKSSVPKRQMTAMAEKKELMGQLKQQKVADLMKVNVDKVLERDEKLSELDDRADVEGVYEMMDDLGEQQEIANEISEAISKPVGFGQSIDEDDLLAELEELIKEEREEQSLNVHQASDNVPSVPVSQPKDSLACLDAAVEAPRRRGARTRQTARISTPISALERRPSSDVLSNIVDINDVKPDVICERDQKLSEPMDEAEYTCRSWSSTVEVEPPRRRGARTMQTARMSVEARAKRDLGLDESRMTPARMARERLEQQIDQVLERSEKLNQLEERSAILEAGASQFKAHAMKLKQKKSEERKETHGLRLMDDSNKWKKISNLTQEPGILDDITEIQNDDGSFELTDELCSAICVNQEECQQVLIDAGINSLGNTTVENVERVLATLLVLLVILKHAEFQEGGLEILFTARIHEIHVRNEDNTLLLYAGDKVVARLPKPDDEGLRSFDKAVKYLKDMQRKYPTIYSTLELSNSLEGLILDILKALPMIDQMRC